MGLELQPGSGVVPLPKIVGVSFCAEPGVQWLQPSRQRRCAEAGRAARIFREDERPWIQAGEGSCQGTVVVMLLRRLGFNLLSLFRSVSQRSEEKRQMPWKDLMRRIYNTLIAATNADTAALRSRKVLTASVA